MAFKFLPSVLWNLDWKALETILATLLVFWCSMSLLNLPLSVPWKLGWKIHGTCLPISVVFWGQIWQPKIGSIFSGFVPSCIQMWEATPPYHIPRTSPHIPPKLPPVMGEYCSFAMFYVGTSFTCFSPPWWDQVDRHLAIGSCTFLEFRSGCVGASGGSRDTKYHML